MQPISISGLTQHQVELLDTMWNMESLEDVQAWQATLGARDHLDSISLQIMLMQELLEQVLLDDTDSHAEVNQILQQFRLQS